MMSDWLKVFLLSLSRIASTLIVISFFILARITLALRFFKHDLRAYVNNPETIIAATIDDKMTRNVMLLRALAFWKVVSAVFGVVAIGMDCPGVVAMGFSWGQDWASELHSIRGMNIVRVRPRRWL